MKKSIFLLLALLAVVVPYAQTITTKLAKAFAQFEKDEQLKSALSSIYVMNASTRKVVFSKNSTVGLAPASTQKIITAATAFEMLGKNFQYNTSFGYTVSQISDKHYTTVYIKPCGDPTLGSWRWKSTTEEAVMERIKTAVLKAGIKNANAVIINAPAAWDAETIPGGWPWDDIGNYYGAGAEALNWRENQYDLIMRSGDSIGDSVKVVKTKPFLYGYDFTSKVTAAAKGSGDNSYLFLPVGSTSIVARGTIPINESNFTISGAMPSARRQFAYTLMDSFMKLKEKDFISTPAASLDSAIFHTEVSPSLDSIIYWFLKRSINLYGEALIKTIAWKDGVAASTENGVKSLRSYWKAKAIGVDVTELNMIDGSGLAPQNRVTTHAQVAICTMLKSNPGSVITSTAFLNLMG